MIADCAGDNAGDSVGPTADAFETYGVTGVALITFIVLAVPAADVQVQLLVWIFAIRVIMVIASIGSYAVNEAIARARWSDVDEMDFEAPLTNLVWLTSIVSVAFTFGVSRMLIPDLGDGTMWWKLSTIISFGTLAGAIIPEFVKIFTSMNSSHVREILTASREGGASLNILAGLTAGNFSTFWMGGAILSLMAGAAAMSSLGLADLMAAPPVFAFGLVAFGFLGMGPVTIAVDSYGPVTDNAQSVYELSMIESHSGVEAEFQRDFGFTPDFARSKHFLEENDGAGNTFKATAKPVLIGTAVVGATTMIFSIIMILTDGLTADIERLSILYPPFLLGFIAGGAVIYWFTGASIQAVSTGAYRAVEFIKRNIRLDTAERASTADSKRVVEICTQYAQRGMINIFLAVFFTTLAFASIEPFFFIGYLIFDRRVRALPGPLYGQCRWSVGQRQEAGRGRAQGERHRPARGHRRGRHGRRSVQGHLLGGDESDHQVHDSVWFAGGRAGHRADPRDERRPRRALPRDRTGLRVALVLPHADRCHARGAGA